MPKKSHSLIHRLLDDGFTEISHERPSGAVSDEFLHDEYMSHRAKMREFPKFYIANDALKTFSNSNYHMVIDMIRKGTIGLPRENMIIELELNPEVTADHYFYIFEHIEGTEREYMASIHRWITAKNAAMSYPLSLRVNLNEGSTQLITHVACAKWFKDLTEFDVRQALAEYENDRGDGTTANFLVAGVRLSLTAFLALWITRGVVKREVVHTVEENRKRARMKLKPLISHTVIKLDERIEYLAGKTFRDKKTGKTRMRLHWRCGHNKMQAYGPNHSLRKEKWIDPYMVGCDENGMITHDYSFTGKKTDVSSISADAPEAPAR